MKNKDGVEVKETKRFNFSIRFNTGEMFKDKPLDKVYGFAIEAQTQDEAKVILKRDLEKCLESLNKVGIAKNEAV